MRQIVEDTPPSSIHGDDISEMEEDILDLEELEEVELDDEDLMEEDEARDVEDNAQLVFRKHDGSVFCCDLHPSGKVAVTGGEDDKAYVWNVNTGDIIMECGGHKDSVMFVGFSFDGIYLATADLSGMIKVWKCNLDDNQQWIVEFEYESEDLTWGFWHFAARVLICGAASGDIYVFKIPSGEIKLLQGQNIKVECGKLLTDGVRLVAGYENGSVKLWDIKACTVLHQIPPGVHNGLITAVDVDPDNNVIVSISTEGKAVIMTSHNGKIVGHLETDDELETVTFSKDPKLGYLALGTLKGSVSIWDVAKRMVRHQCAKSDEEAGVTKMIWIENNLVTGCLDGCLRVYEGKSGERNFLLSGHTSEILDFCYNAQENILLTTSSDKTARIFKYDINKN
ncbi:Angio-associated migratory cell protein [Eumeta japonica]|uniref:Angio-associated migratory cell protein n=1 Tax=Eumeta variegata TaxID=151549 RepID=A0A4C2AB06_EUMVA|nr:Angio-associated migratory cell protein [Eumeta japonica]